jgi:hypothetical protein
LLVKSFSFIDNFIVFLRFLDKIWTTWLSVKKFIDTKETFLCFELLNYLVSVILMSWGCNINIKYRINGWHKLVWCLQFVIVFLNLNSLLATLASSGLQAGVVVQYRAEIHQALLPHFSLLAGSFILKVLVRDRVEEF